MIDINLIKEELTVQFPEYSFFTTRRLIGRCIVARKSKYYGADIFIKKDRMVIEAAIPDWGTRLLLGAGALYKKISDPNFSEVAIQMKEFLSSTYKVSLRR